MLKVTKIRICDPYRTYILVLHKWMSLLQITIWTRATTYYARGYIVNNKKERLTVTLHFKGQFAFFALTHTYATPRKVLHWVFVLYGCWFFSSYLVSAAAAAIKTKPSTMCSITCMHTFIFTCVYRTHAIPSVTVQMRIRAYVYGFELIKAQIKWIIIILKIKWYECHASTLSSYPLHSFIHIPLFCCSAISFYLFIAILIRNHISFFISDSSISLTTDYMLHCIDRWSCDQATTVNLSDECESHNNQIGAEQNRNCAFGLFFV